MSSCLSTWQLLAYFGDSLSRFFVCLSFVVVTIAVVGHCQSLAKAGAKAGVWHWVPAHAQTLAIWSGFASHLLCILQRLYWKGLYGGRGSWQSPSPVLPSFYLPSSANRNISSIGDCHMISIGRYKSFRMKEWETVAFLVFFSISCFKDNVCSSFRRTVGQNITG